VPGLHQKATSGPRTRLFRIFQVLDTSFDQSVRKLTIANWSRTGSLSFFRSLPFDASRVAVYDFHVVSLSSLSSHMYLVPPTNRFVVAAPIAAIIGIAIIEGPSRP
jgi:hypothetical protein